MSSNAKVGSWLEHNDKSQAEAYESASEDENLADGRVNGIDMDEEEEDVEVAGEVTGKREDDINWEELGQSMRFSLSDPSKKRRRAFISRYLYISDQCKYCKNGCFLLTDTGFSTSTSSSTNGVDNFALMSFPFRRHRPQR